MRKQRDQDVLGVTQIPLGPALPRGAALLACGLPFALCRVLVVIPCVQCSALLFDLAFRKRFLRPQQFVNLCHGWLSFRQSHVLDLLTCTPQWKCRKLSIFAALYIKPSLFKNYS